MRRLAAYMKKETVLTVAVVLAGLSALFVRPDAGYAGYIDCQTLAQLFCLMLVMAGLKELGIFGRMGAALLGKVKRGRQVAAVLIFLCFFSGMVITNDVALLTFVPFAIEVLQMAGLEGMLIPVVTFQTVAANLGSMLTPIGNPQNLYLYSRSGMGAGEFISLMFPYAAIAFFMLVLCSFSVRGGKAVVPALPARGQTMVPKGKLILYLALFFCCIGSVAHVIPWPVLLAVVAMAVLAADRVVFAKVDYALLATFAAFFIFIGNMGRVPAFYGFLSRIVRGNEILSSVLASQVISNVPAALLLSGFTDRWPALIIGTNLGGLGTLIASMASLISYKSLIRAYRRDKGPYICYFTVVNVGFLAVLLLAASAFAGGIVR